ncbi:MAG: hypothetical protein F6K30_28700 [Cyanothece sp. SIO2G6]|nr:hypothetical protein [Cyanothece sp. SIO2G6]
MSDIHFNAPVGQVNTDQVTIHGDNIGTQNIFHGSNPEAATLAQELDTLLQDLKTDPTDAAASDAALKELEKQPDLKQRLIAAVKAGSITAIEEFCKHPLAKVALSALKAAFPEK